MEGFFGNIFAPSKSDSFPFQPNRGGKPGPPRRNDASKVGHSILPPRIGFWEQQNRMDLRERWEKFHSLEIMMMVGIYYL